MERTFRETSLGNISYLHRAGDYSLIFLHGLGGSSNNWLRLEKKLDSRLELYFMDLLGHGRTAASDWDYTILGQAKMVQEFIENSGIENYGIVGNSYGGWVSALYASKVAKPEFLVLEDSAGINPTVGEWDRERMDAFMERLQSFGRFNDPEVMRRIVIQNSTGNEKLKKEDLAAIGSKTMVVWGMHDEMIDIEFGKEMSSSIGGSKFEVLDSAGHIPHYTHPDEIAGLINRFIFS